MAPVDSRRIALFVERAAVLRSSKAVATIDATTMTMRFAAGEPRITVDIAGPDDEATLAYFTRIREFDTRRKPIYVADFFDELEVGASPRRLEVVRWLRQAHHDLGREPYDRASHVLGRGATPRQVWELWTYAHLIHVEEAKRSTWNALDGYQQGAAKFVAYSYAGDLFHVVMVTDAMLRDPGLDDRGVRMQTLTIDARFAGANSEPFRAAKIRLLT